MVQRKYNFLAGEGRGGEGRLAYESLASYLHIVVISSPACSAVLSGSALVLRRVARSHGESACTFLVKTKYHNVAAAGNNHNQQSHNDNTSPQVLTGESVVSVSTIKMTPRLSAEISLVRLISLETKK